MEKYKGLLLLEPKNISLDTTMETVELPKSCRNGIYHTIRRKTIMTSLRYFSNDENSVHF